MGNAISEILAFLKERFNLSGDRANEEVITAEIRRGVEFSGVNLWVLIFAIMVASLGLNVNSTAVIIGAMLISPLMGPIMGVGLGIGISDMDLIKKALKNLGIMVIISVLTSSTYFALSPLSEAQSELLARTTPTIYDVFIALFGGLAGIVATSSRERGNVIPGVAIATALMPPLCTAGFGLATGSLKYFAGAFYLFSINTVFICFSTLIVVRLLRFQEVSFLSAQTSRRVHGIMAVIIALMVIPSIFIARNLVLETVFKNKCSQFVKTEFNFPSTEVLKQEFIWSPEKVIKIALMGTPLDENTLTNLENQLSVYGLNDVKLIVKQNETFAPENLKSQVLETFFERNLDSLKSKDERIKYLSQQLVEIEQRKLPADRLAKEANTFNRNISRFSVQPVYFYDAEGKPADTLHIALIKFEKTASPEEIKRLTDWLKTRLESNKVKIMVRD